MSPRTKNQNPTPPTDAARSSAQGSAPIPEIAPRRSAAPAGARAGQAAPALAPPGLRGAAQAPADGATATSATVGGLYASDHAGNAWVYLNAVGWRRIASTDTGAHHAMLQIARMALDAAIPVQCDEDGSTIHAIYAW
jgi:hypothetical protein